MTTPARIPIPAWVCLSVCVAATVFDLVKAWTADTTADRLIFLSLAACTAVVGVWWWRVIASHRRDAERYGSIEDNVVPDPTQFTATLSGLRRPEGVTIHHPDGTSTVCELAYAGRDEHGHAWHVATPFRVGVDRITIDVLPPGCYVAVPIAGSNPPH